MKPKQEMNMKRLVSYEIKKLKPLGFNPSRRIEDGRMLGLSASMKEIGQLLPILVSSSGTVIDGHRRLAVAKKLRWTHIDAVVVSGSNDHMLLYRSINSTSAKMNGNDALGIWLKEPLAVTQRQAKIISTIEGIIGRPMLEKLYSSGLSTRTYLIACQITRLCDCESPAQIRRVINWLITHSMTGRVMKAIEGGQDPMVIMQAVKKNKPVSLKLMAG